MVLGGSGDDRLNGGNGRDTLKGGSGNEVINTRDKTKDFIKCGAGQDKVAADRVDKVAGDCEIARRK